MIRFRRQKGGTTCSEAAAAPAALRYGEPGVDSAGTVYMGDGAGNVVSRVKYSERSAFDCPLYHATYTADGWRYEAVIDKYTQTKNVTPEAGAPAMTAAKTLMIPMVPRTNTKEDAHLSEELNKVNIGGATPGAGTITAFCYEKPDCDLTIYWGAR